MKEREGGRGYEGEGGREGLWARARARGGGGGGGGGGRQLV